MKPGTKRFAASLLAFVLSSAATSFAQTTDDVEVMRSLVQTERKAVVAKNMELTEAESQAFWPVYNDYHQALREVNDRRVELIRQLGEEFETLSGDRAQEMLKDFLKFQQERANVRKSYLKRFNKVLPAKKVVRYYQIENKLDAIVDFELARTIPLVE